MEPYRFCLVNSDGESQVSDLAYDSATTTSIILSVRVHVLPPTITRVLSAYTNISAPFGTAALRNGSYPRFQSSGPKIEPVSTLRVSSGRCFPTLKVILLSFR